MNVDKLRAAAADYVARFIDPNYEQSEASHTHCFKGQLDHKGHLACCLCGIQSAQVWKFKFGQKVKKISGSMWHGKVVGFYTTELNNHGYNVESSSEVGSVQNYPEKALMEDN